ncbi:Uncharacterized membrane protein, BrkB/YihY/UPF0761 family (not an RNase) [Alkalispirochaeta americana]|uniref:Uncharacterized membrane protein, BrkB/YihY/UPF0761 family (Not an RNase) n=1 Tax=Alkalispirochaeta americana TaxID=159291 RepID=A0A1N6UVT2_9SPIO|nr:YhjD/YihY/BrkB family envelope integrity protein [Alkalispirochaeta americana]SIQ69744.1 Uncharacterized membrane protein, BrkB/YihY/UPF0761 family (not an RNase) [Alkalispirochaeta americana]
MGYLRKIYHRYKEIHGPLLAKGLSFSALFAVVPLLFLLTLAGSFALTPKVQALVEQEILYVLPVGAQRSIMLGLERYASAPGSLSIITLGVFLYTVHTLFFDIHRVIRAAFGIPLGRGTGRLRALALNGVFLLLIYVSALITLAVALAGSYLPGPSWLLALVARFSALAIQTIVIWSMIRLSSGVPLKLVRSLPPALLAAGAWQGASWIMAEVVLSTGRRVLVYGVLASAISLLALTRIYAEILLQAALWTALLNQPQQPSGQEPPPPPHSRSDPVRQ